MANVLDFSQFSFTAEQIRDINKLVFDKIVSAPEINALVTLYDGIVYDKEIGFITGSGLVGVANQGCNPTPQDWNINTRKITWTPKGIELLIEQCWSTLESTAATYALHTGVRRPDFTTTDYMAIVVRELVEAVKQMFTRLVWFSDTAITTSELTAGTGIEYFNVLDGLWKQIFAEGAANPKVVTTITENSGATYAAQKINPDNILGYLEGLVFNAPMPLRQQTDGVIYATQSFVDAYTIAMSKNSGSAYFIDKSYENTINGQFAPMYMGIPIIAVPFWDKLIRGYFDNGTVWTLPNRAIYTTKSNLAVGVDGEGSFSELNTFYLPSTRTVRMELMAKLDAKLLNPNFISMAY